MSDNPFESTVNRASFPQQSRWKFRLVELLVVMAVLGILAALFLPVRRVAREPARRAGCINNMRQIGLAVLNYESANGKLPPAYTVGADGNRLHSWRTLILPYFEEGELYESIDLTKPWDDPANAHAREAVITPYLCPSVYLDDESKTTYLAIVGKEQAFTGSVAREFGEIQESVGSSRAPILADVPAEQAVHWMSPYDIDIETLSRLNDPSDLSHDGIVHISFLDNHVQSVSVEGLKEFFDQIRDVDLAELFSSDWYDSVSRAGF